MTDGERIPPENELQIMLAEYTMLQQSRETILDVMNQRVNFYIAAVSGVAVGIGIIKDVTGGSVYLDASLLALSVSLLLLGLVTYLRVLEGYISSYIYIRGLNRVRRYFVERAPDTSKYFILPTTDSTPRFQHVGYGPTGTGLWLSFAGVIAIINSIVGGVVVFALLQYAIWLDDTWRTALAAVAIAAMLAAYQIYQYRRLEQAEQQQPVNFPKNGSANDRYFKVKESRQGQLKMSTESASPLGPSNEVLLAEYHEVAEGMRFHSDVRWKLLSVFVVVAGGAIALSKQFADLYVPLNAFALLTSCVFAIVEYRTQLMWHMLFRRAVKIETLLGLESEGAFSSMISAKRPWYWLDSTKAIRIGYLAVITYFVWALVL